MQKSALFTGSKRFEEPITENCRGEWQRSAGKPLGDTEDVGLKTLMLVCKKFTGSAKSSHDLICDDQSTMIMGELDQGRKRFGRGHLHAAGTLNHWLNNDPSQTIAQCFKERI